MKFRRILPIFIIAGILFSSANVFSQETAKKTSKFPKERLGLGIHVTAGQTYGGIVSYSIESNIHIGAGLGFKYDGGKTVAGVETGAETYFLFAPFARYFFDNVLSFRPFVQGSFQFTTISVEETESTTGASSERADSFESFIISVGGQWFPYKSVGVLGGFRVISYTLEPANIQVGLMEPFIGIEWFL